MKKILFMLFLFTLALPSFADNVDLTYYFELAKANNIDVEKVQKSPYFGTPYSEIKRSKKPYLIVFADFNDVPTAAKFANNGYFVYNNLQGQYGFSAFNINHEDNADLIERFSIESAPYVLVTNPKRNEIIPIKPELYDNPTKLVKLLKAYARRR